MKRKIRTYLRVKTDYPIPEAGQSGGEEIAPFLANALRETGFNASEAENGEFAYFIRCPSGQRVYEIMIGYNFGGGSTWEISCPPILGSFSRLMGKSEDNDLLPVITAIDRAMRSNTHVQEMFWYRSYGGRRHGSALFVEHAN